MKTISFKKNDPAAVIPRRAYPDDAGLDLVGIESAVLQPGEGKIFKTGLSCAVDPGYVAMICDRSSMGKRGLRVLGGIVDSGYRGEIGIILWNVSREVQNIQAGDRIAQVLIMPVVSPEVVEVRTLPDSIRGTGGFGSSGK